MSEDNIVSPEDIANATQINEEYSWKDEVTRLLDQIEYMKQEIVANQLMVGLILRKTGEITVPKSEIAKGLPGYQIDLEDDGTDVTFRLAQLEQ